MRAAAPGLGPRGSGPVPDGLTACLGVLDEVHTAWPAIVINLGWNSGLSTWPWGRVARVEARVGLGL